MMYVILMNGRSVEHIMEDVLHHDCPLSFDEIVIVEREEEAMPCEIPNVTILKPSTILNFFQNNSKCQFTMVCNGGTTEQLLSTLQHIIKFQHQVVEVQKNLLVKHYDFS